MRIDPIEVSLEVQIDNTDLNRRFEGRSVVSRDWRQRNCKVEIQLLPAGTTGTFLMSPSLPVQQVPPPQREGLSSLEAH